MNRSTELNKLPVTVLPVAVSSEHGVSKLYRSENGSASNSLIGIVPAHTVVTITLDWLLGHFPPQVLKIDVEGAEYAVLKGALNVLQSRPLIFCEVTDNHSLVGELLTGANYKLYAAREQIRRPLQRPSRDTLAVPDQP